MKPAVILALGLVATIAGAQPVNDNFAGATVIAGASGSTNGDNSLATLESCEAAQVNTPLYPNDDQTNSVWFAWKCPTNGLLEVDSAGSAFEVVLSVWTSTNAVPSLCDGSLNNLISDDDGQLTYSQVQFPVTAGSTYYISVASYNDASLPFDNAGAFVLNWHANYPTVPTGKFKFTQTAYTVSQLDSDSPNVADGNTVSSSLLGARVTVTRPMPAYGRVLVDYSLASGFYTNTVLTNYFGTNVLTEILSTDLPPVITISNNYFTNIVIVSGTQYYENGYRWVYSTNAFTNAASVWMTGVSMATNPMVSGALTPVPTNLPVTTNYQSSSSTTAGGFTITSTTNAYGYLQPGRISVGTNFLNASKITNNGVIYTNYAVIYTNLLVTNIFGANVSQVYAPVNFNGSYYSTNYFFTNVAIGLYYVSNSIYTNGVNQSSVIVSGADWNWGASLDLTNLVVSFLNASNYFSSVTRWSSTSPAPTNWFAGNYTDTSFSFDTSGNEYIVSTNVYSTSSFGTEVVLSGAGITLGSGTIVFDNLQMSADILVPVVKNNGPSSYATITISNPRLDPLEDTNNLIAPTLDPAASTVSITALSPDFNTVGIEPLGRFAFERSTFRTSKNVGNAIISVNRYKGAAKDSVSVDYTIDPDYPNYMAISPHNDDDPLGIVNLYHPANSFPLQAGSDYATPDSDFTSVSGTLTWGAFDYGAKQISIPILNNGLVEFNQDLLIQLHNALPVIPTTYSADDMGTVVGQVNQAVLTILFDDRNVLGGAFPGQQPAGAVDRSWNKNNAGDSNPSFINYPGTTPGNGGTVYAVAEQPDGNAIIAGSFVSFDSHEYNRIVRVLPNGYQDPAFQGNFSPWFNGGANDTILALALQPDGQILIGGNFTAYNGTSRRHLARLNSDGSLDVTFKPGNGANGGVTAMALEPNGQIIIAGSFTQYNGVTANRLARLNADGSLDTNFVAAALGTGTNISVNALAVDSAGRILIGGNFTTVAGVVNGGVARLNADGSLDTTFAAGVGTFNPNTSVTDPVRALAVQPDGKVLVGGAFAYYNLYAQNGLLRLTTNGTLDLTFRPGTGTFNPITKVADTVYSILLQPDNNILIGGNFMAYNQTRRIGLARLFSDGTLDTSFMDTAYNELAGVPSQYFNPNVVTTNYPYVNTRSIIYSMALETNSVTTRSNIIIGGTFTRVGGGATRDSILPRSNVARVIGGATPGPGNIQLEYDNYSVNNSDGSLYVSLWRTNGNLGSVSATFFTNTSGSGAGIAGGADFSLNPLYTRPTWITWYSYNDLAVWDNIVGFHGPNYYEIPNVNPRPTGADVYINVYNSGKVTGNLSANFGLTAPTTSFMLGGQYIPMGPALGYQSSAPLTIIDSNVKAGVIGFSAASYLVIENGSTATITLTRTNGSANSVSVSYATTDITATNGVDYTGSTNTVLFAAGQTSASFTVPTRSHYTSIQPDKKVSLRLFTPTAGASLGLSNAVLTLINPNYAPGHVSLSLTNYVVNENDGTALVTVNRLGGSTGTMQVTLASVDGSARTGTNYVAINTNLFWNSGDATARTISIPVMRDGVVTSNLVAYLRLTNSLVSGTNNAVPLSFGGTNATLTINNVDSAGSFQFSSASYSVKKYGGYALIPVTRTGGSVGTVTIQFSTQDDTATNGLNYVGMTNTLTFTNGQVSQIMTVPILPVNGTNGLKDLYLHLGTNGLVTLASLGSPTNATLYIVDSDSINESPGSSDTTYSSLAGFNDNVYSLVLQTNNQLLVGGDFTMADGVTRNRIARLNADGSLDATFSLPSSDMGVDGPVRSIAVQADGRILLGGFFTNVNSTARGHLARLNYDGTLDNLFDPGSGADNPVYAVAQTFVSGEPMVLVGGAFVTIGGTAFNGIGRLYSDGTPDDSFNATGVGANDVVYALALQSDGKIVIGGDFTSVNGATNFNHIARLNADGSTDTNFNVGGLGASDSVRAIAIQLDGRILIGGLFTNVNGVALNHIARLNADGTVDASFHPQPGANDSVFALALQNDNRVIVGGGFTTCSGVTRGHVTRLNPDGSVDPSINFGTGANDSVAAIAVQEDSIAGYPASVPDEKILIGGGFTQYNSESHPHIARIFGGAISGSGAFEFSAGNYQIDETGVNAVITVMRTGGTTNAVTGDVFVTATTSNGTAVAGINYSNVVATLDFPLGEVIKTFNVSIKDDGVVTPNLTVNLALSNPTAPAVLGSQPTAVLTIVNDDSVICFSNITYSVSKNDVSGMGAIDIVRSGGTNVAATVAFMTTSNGTAAAGTDFTPVSQTVTFNPGVRDVMAYVPIINNGLAEGNRTVTLLLSNAVGSTLVSPTNATLTIVDTATAAGQLRFSDTNFMASSDQPYAYLAVLRTNGASGTVSVNYHLVPGTAQPGVNYIAASGSLTFEPGITNQTIAVQLVNSGIIQAPVALSVQLSNPTNNATLTDPTNATLTIYNTNAVFAFAAATNIVGEEAGFANIVVMRYNNTNAVNTVQFSTIDGTAVAGTNYSQMSGALTFLAGESSKSISVPLINQSNVVSKQFTMALTNTSGGYLVAPSNTVVILEGSAANISFVTNRTTVFKNGGSVVLTVVCSNPRVETSGLDSHVTPLEVSYVTVPGTAQAGIGYGGVSGTLVFTNGVGTNTITVPILNNSTVSSNLTFSVLLTNVTSPGRLSPYAAETVEIDESNSGLRFSQAGYNVYKNGVLATINVLRTGYTNSIATVDYLVTNGTALAGVNFYSTNGTLIFTNGQTSQAFDVYLIANSQVQPNLTAFMELLNPTNGFLVSPALSTLTILENGGSYVVPAGAQMLTNYSSHLKDGVIYSNDTVLVNFAFRDIAGMNVGNLVARLLATNNVTPVTNQQSYGPLQVYRHSVSMPFAFTVHGTNGLTATPTFQLYDTNKFIGMGSFTFTLGSWGNTFAYTNPIYIYAGGTASNYPAVIRVSGLGNSILKAAVTLTNLSAGSLGELDALVVSPTTNTLIMGHAGGTGTKITRGTLTFDDSVTNATFTVPSSGKTATNNSTQNYPILNFP